MLQETNLKIDFHGTKVCGGRKTISLKMGNRGVKVLFNPSTLSLLQWMAKAMADGSEDGFCPYKILPFKSNIVHTVQTVFHDTILYKFKLATHLARGKCDYVPTNVFST